MPRTREFDPDQALEQALGLFWSHGYSDTSMEELVEATGVSRYGLYGAFGNKRELFEKALRRYWQHTTEEICAPLLEDDASLPQVRAYFERMRAMSESRQAREGCLVCNSAVEMAHHDPEVAALVRELLEETRQLVLRAFTNAVRKEELAAGTDVEALATFVVVASTGLAVLSRAGFPHETLEGGLATVIGALG